eukprot:3553279-Amphidinium_carterae.1
MIANDQERQDDIGHARLHEAVATDQELHEAATNRWKLRWPMIDMLYVKLKSNHSKEQVQNTLRLWTYLSADRSTLNAAMKHFLDYC